MNDQYIIKKALTEDALGIHEAHMKSIQELCTEGYAHLKFYTDNNIKKAHVMGLYLTLKSQFEYRSFLIHF